MNALVVDDEPEFINLIKFFLERDHGISVDPAHSVKDALAALDSGRYDAIVSDYQMSELDGLDFLKIVRAKGSDMPFILLTGKGREDVAVEALNLGANFYVQKHGDLKSMYAELANAIRQSVDKNVALESLRSSESTYRQLVELAQEGIWVIDRNGVTTFVNPRMAQMLGYSKEEMLGQNFLEFMDESLRDKASGYLGRRVNGFSEEHEFDFLRKDGTTIHAFLGTSPVIDDDGVVQGAMAVVTDISDRIRAENLLRKERDSAQQYLDIAAVMILCLDHDGNVTLINRRGCEILGYEEGDIIGKNWFDGFLPERDRARIREVFKDVLNARVTREDPVTNAVLTKSGEERVIRWHNVTIRGENGRITQTLSSGEDVTELLQYERRLQRKFEESEAIASLSTMLISPTLSVAELAKMVLMSALSLTDSEHGYVSPVDPVTRAVTSHTLTEMIEGGSCRIEGRGAPLVFPIGPDGTYPSLWGFPLNSRGPFYTNCPEDHNSSTGVPEGHIPLVNFLSTPVLYGEELVGQISMANSCRDYDDDDLKIISRLADIFAVALQRERDLATLVMMQSRFRSFMEHVPAVTYLKDLDRRYVFVNRQYEELLDRTEESMLGRTDMELWPEQTADQFSENDSKVMSSGRPERYIELVPVAGEIRQYLSFKFPVIDSQGRLTLLGGVSADITDMRRVEEALHVANEKLRFIGHITRHDALNQISVLKGWLSLAAEDSGSAEVESNLEKISAALDSLARQLEFAADFELIGLDTQAWMGVNEVCKSTWSEFKAADVVLDCQCEGVEILADPLFPKVLRNLIDNTLRHSGGARRVEISCEEAEDAFMINYQDDGVGIPPELKEKVFERGFGTNTGLGLYLVRELLRTSGMTIRETGEEGKGARFEIRIPTNRCRVRKS